MLDLSFLASVGSALAGTGTEADGAMTRGMALMVGLGVMGIGGSIVFAGIKHAHNSEHITATTATALGFGATMVAGGAGLSAYLTGHAMGATGANPAVSALGAALSEIFNPIGPLSVMLLYRYYRVRKSLTRYATR